MDNVVERNEDAILEEQIISEMEELEAQDDDVGFNAHENTYEEPEPDPLGNTSFIGIRHDWDEPIDPDDDDEDPWIDKKVTGQEAFEYQRILRKQEKSAGRLIGYDTESIMKAAVRIWISKNRKLLNLPLLLDNCGAKRNCVIDGKQYAFPIPVMEAIRTEIIATYDELRIEANDALKKSDSTKLKKFDDLPGWVIADILVATGGVRVLNTKHGRNTVGTEHLIFKDYFKNKWTNGKMKWSGQWRQYQEKSRTDLVNKFFRKLCPSATSADKEDFVTRLYSEAPVSYINARNDLIFWRNGVWDYTLQKFTNYDDDDYEELYGDVICMSKYAVNHPLGRMWGGQEPMKFDANGNCIEPVRYCHDKAKWTPSMQLKAPFKLGTPQGDASYDCIIRFFQFTLRGMNGSPMVYHIWIDGIGGGQNGKGATGDILQNLMTPEGMLEGCEDLHPENLILPVPMEDLGEDHKLGSNLLYARWIRGQESDGSTKVIKNCRMIKDLSRGNPVMLRDLYENAISIAYDGGLSQEINCTPIFAEKDGAMLGHMLIIPFDIKFGLTKPYIKSKYLKELEVRSWFAWYLTTQLPCYEAYDEHSLNVLQGKSDEVMRDNMGTVQFFDEILPMLPGMDVIPPELIFPLYNNWCTITHSKVVDKKTFIKDMQEYALMKGSAVDFCASQRRLSAKDVKYQQGIPGKFHGMEAIRRYGYDKYNHPEPFVLKAQYTNNDSYTDRSDLLDWSYFGDVTYSNIQEDNTTIEIKGLKQFRNCFIRKKSFYDDPSQCITTYSEVDDNSSEEVAEMIANEEPNATNPDIEEWVKNASPDAVKAWAIKYLMKK